MASKGTEGDRSPSWGSWCWPVAGGKESILELTLPYRATSNMSPRRLSRGSNTCLLSCELGATEEVEEVSWDSGISKLLLLQSRFDCKKQVRLPSQQPSQCPHTLTCCGPVSLYPTVASGYPSPDPSSQGLSFAPSMKWVRHHINCLSLPPGHYQGGHLPLMLLWPPTDT